MEFNYYVQINENKTSDLIKKIIQSPMKYKTVLQKNFDRMIRIINNNDLEEQFLAIINKQFKTHYKSLKELQNLKEGVITEDWKHFLQFWKGETYPALSIFPTLQIWFEVDKLLDGVNLADLNWKKIVIYGLFWLIIVTGQHALLWNKWRKEHPEDYNKEGKPGVFLRGRKKHVNS